MNGQSPYWQKLQDPRWQKKRLEVFERDKFACRDCGSKDKTLQVHHKYYISKREPWEYPLGAFLTLCKPCHAAMTDFCAFAQPLTWEAFVALENEMDASGADHGFVQSLVRKATELKCKETELFSLICNALDYDVIDHETVALWRAKIKEEIDIETANGEACRRQHE